MTIQEEEKRSKKRSISDCLTKVIYDDEDNIRWLGGDNHILAGEEEQEEGDEGHGGLGLEGDQGLALGRHGGPHLEGHGTGPTSTHTLHHLHHFRQEH